MTAHDMNGDWNARPRKLALFYGLALLSKVNPCPQKD